MTQERATIRFTVTEEHLKLLRHMYVRWNGDESGAPTIDPKRPYGNSNVLDDIAELLDADLYDPRTGDHDGEAVARFEQIHNDTETALQIVLCVGAFEAGTYEADKYRRNWTRIAPLALRGAG